MTTDLRQPQGVIKEIFDPDESVRTQFQNAVAAEAMAFAEAFAPVFAQFAKFETICQGSLQRNIVGALIHGVLDDCLTSVKLLLSGKLMSSGNLARQATEGICMAMMAAHPQELEFAKAAKEHYWRLFESNDERAQGNRAPHQVVHNAAALGLAQGAAAQLRSNIELHHPASHAGQFAMAGRMELADEGRISFGGHFDRAKLDGYRKEIQDRIGICKWAGEVMRELAPKVEKLPLDPA
jgi:hypothetical protein